MVSLRPVPLARLGAIVFVLSVTATLLQSTPAYAYTVCGRHSWVKSTVLNSAPQPSVTEAEVQETAGYNTMGTGTHCWGSGISGFKQHTSVSASYCYVGPLISDNLIDCTYSLTGDTWWVYQGEQQYLNMTATINGHYRNSGTDYHVKGSFTIQSDGTYSHRCWTTGTITYPYETDCHNGGTLNGQ
jgi:hypothetical protein